MTRDEAVEAAGMELAKAIADLGLRAPVATVTEMPTAKTAPRRRRRTDKAA